MCPPWGGRLVQRALHQVGKDTGHAARRAAVAEVLFQHGAGLAAGHPSPAAAFYLNRRMRNRTSGWARAEGAIPHPTQSCARGAAGIRSRPDRDERTSPRGHLYPFSRAGNQTPPERWSSEKRDDSSALLPQNCHHAPRDGRRRAQRCGRGCGARTEAPTRPDRSRSQP